MTVVTIPRQLANEELVIISKKEYEEMKRGRQLQSSRQFKEVAMTKIQKLAFVRAERNFAQGKFLTLDELKQKLARRR